MVKKYPHTATISWLSAGTMNTYGVWSPGTLNTLRLLACDIQPVTNRYLTGAGGAVLNYNWDIFAERFSGDTTVPVTAKLTFFNAAHILIQLFNYENHVEIKCQD
jgi:hypothetical protein